MMNVRYGIVLHCRCTMALSFTLCPEWRRVLTYRVTRSSMVGADIHAVSKLMDQPEPYLGRTFSRAK
jgi:hypothetical protein